MKIYLQNTLTRQKEEFVPIQPGKVGFYSCGPTVYSTPHIGNLRAYIFSDTLRRVLAIAGYEVTQVVNITDVGHLSTDGDDGEDKLEKGARQSGKTVWEVAKFYEEEFLASLKELKILEPTVLPRATEHIAEQIAMISTLEEKGFVYETSDGLYFDTARFEKYGQLSGQDLTEKLAGARVEANDEKRNPTDFALWKFCVAENANHAMRWNWQAEKLSPADISEEEVREKRIGFPGWHIECSAMGMKYLGNQFDIHTGGIDHIPVHHENEIAQAEATTGQKFVNYWLHNNFLTVDGGKMSKSLGNLYSVEDLKSRGYDALAYRYLCLGTHYRSKLNFTFQALDAAAAGIKNLQKSLAVSSGVEVGEPDTETLKKFHAALSDDLATPQALAVVHEFAKRSDLEQSVRAATIFEFERGLGLGLGSEIAEEKVELTDEQESLLAERLQAREEKNWQRADEIRDLFAEQGLLVEDTADGQVVRRG